MPSLSVRNTLSLGFAALLLVAATSGATALFRAPSPGQTLQPVNGAGEIIQILQGRRTILWATLGGSVGRIVTQGWPSSSGVSELGGALMIEIPADPKAGVIEPGERPMTVTFETG